MRLAVCLICRRRVPTAGHPHQPPRLLLGVPHGDAAPYGAGLLRGDPNARRYCFFHSPVVRLPKIEPIECLNAHYTLCSRVVGLAP